MANQETRGVNIKITADASELNKEIRSAQANVKQLASVFRSTKDLTKFDATSLMAYKAQLSLLTEEQKAQRDVVNGMTTRLEQLNAQYAGEKSKLDEMTASGKYSDEQMKSQTDTVHQLGVSIDKLTVQRDKESSKLLEINNTYTQTKRTVDELTESEKLNGKSFEEAVSNIKLSIGSLDSQISNLKKVTDLDPSNLNNYRDELSLLSEKISEQKELLNQYDTQILNTNNQLDEARLKYQQLSSVQGQNTEEVESAKNKADYLQKTVDKLNSERDEEAASLRKTQAEYESLNAKMLPVTDDYNKQIKALNENEESLDKQYKSLTRLSKIDPDNINLFTKRIETLKDKLIAQNEAVELYNSHLEKMEGESAQAADSVEKLTNEYGENSAEVRQAASAYDQIQDEIRQTTNARNEEIAKIEETKATLKNLNDGEKELGDSTEVVSGKMDAFTVALGNLMSRGIERSIYLMRDLSKEVVDTGKAFEDSMSSLAAILGKDLDSNEISDLADNFSKLSENSMYSQENIAENAKTLANAGYTIDEIKDTIGDIDNLSIGTGEDFNSMVQITVDGLKEFNMSTKESTHFVDVLAKSAVSSNTNVTQMGEALTYAGAVAGSFGYDIEDVATALGAMASQGVKGSIAGTALRQLITRLAAPVKESKEAMDGLGLSFYNADGSARPLMDVLNELRTKLNGLRRSEKAAYEKQLAGQRGLTGLSAIINMSNSDWQTLTASIRDYNGTVQKMADTKMDTYSGQVAKLKNMWHETASEMFNEVEPSLIKTMKSLNKLMKSDAFKTDLSKTVGKVSSLIDGLSKAIDKSDGHIIDTAEDAVKMFAAFGGATIATKNVLKFGGGIAKFIKNIEKAKSRTQDFTSVLGFLVNNASAVGLAIGATTAVIAGFAIAIQNHKDRINEAAEAEAKLSDKSQEVIDKADDYVSNYDSVTKTTDSNIKSIDSQYSHYEDLIDQYDKLIDANGNVKAGYEEQADTILTTLSNAFGIEKDDIQSLIDKYGDLKKAMDEVMNQAKLSAYLNAYQDDYQQAIEQQDTLNGKVSDSYDALYEARRNAGRLQEDLDNAKKARDEFVKDNSKYLYQGGSTSSAYLQVLKKYDDEIESYKAAVEQANGKVNDAQKAYKKYSGAYVQARNDITNYEKASYDAQIKDASQYQSDMDALRGHLKSAGNASVSDLKKQADENHKTYIRMKNDRNGVYSKKDIDEQYRLASAAWGQYYTALNQQSAEAGTSAGNGFVDSASTAIGGGGGNGEKLMKAAVSAKDLIKSSLNLSDGELSVVGDSYLTALSNAIASGDPTKIANATNAIKAQVHYGLSDTSQTSADGVASTNAFALGMSGNSSMAAAHARLTQAAASGELGKTDPFNTAGKGSSTAYGSGISSNGKAARDAASSVAKEAAGSSGFGSGDASGSGYNLAAGFAKGISHGIDVVVTAAKNLAQKALEKIRSIGGEGSPWKTTTQSGEWLAEGLQIGIEKQEKYVTKAAGELADSTLSQFTELPDTMASIGIQSMSVLSDSMDSANGRLQRVSQGIINDVADKRIDVKADYSGNSAMVTAVSVLQTEVSDLKDNMNGMIDALNNENRNFNFNIPFEINGRQFAKATASYTQEELNSIEKINNRRNGIK